MSPFGLPSAGYPASARWHVFRSRRSAAFTLLEVLVATAVLALMMTFLFNLLGSSAKIWEIGNKKIEAAQAARVGLNIMAADLKNAFAGNMTSYTTNGTAIQNIAPFYAVDSPSNAIDVAAAGQPVNTDGSQQVFGVLSSSDSSLPYKEFGFLCVFLKNKDGTDPMIGHRYYLLRKLSNTGSSSADFFLRTAGTDWAGTTSTSGFNPIIDNCIRLKLAYFGNTSSATGTPTLTTAWSPQDRLPLGVLVTISVLDTKTAEKIAAINAGTPLTDLQISNGLSSSPPSDLTTVERLIAQGSVTMSRFIPFNAN
jgi:type II secretory pathway pseudopilin PulG